MTTIRETFLPDEGCVFVRCDLSQIEDRMCKMYCGTPRMVEIANRRPDVYDAHTDNACKIFKKTHAEIEADKKAGGSLRYLGKKVVHGSQRGLRGVKMSESISKDTDGKVFVHPAQCDKLIDVYLADAWEIPQIYFPWVEQRVRDDRVLYTSWGRRLDLRYRRIDADLYREAYSFYLQAECADWTNQYGFVPATYWMIGKYGRPLNAQVHDEIIASVPLLESYEYARFVVDSMEQKREIPKGSGNWLCVPADITVGRSWGDKKGVEFKKLPEKEEFYRELTKGGFFNAA